MSARQRIPRQIARGWKTASTVLLLTFLASCLTWAQSAPPPSQGPQPSQDSGKAQKPRAGGAGKDQPSQSDQQADEKPQPETHLTKQQAKELFRSVDEILHFVSVDTLLPIEHKVKPVLITRAEVERYVDKKMKDDKDAKRLEQSRLVLEKFGLLPKGYDLHAEFLRLMGEQVAAYYDPKNESINMLDWLPADAQLPVLAHELTHALQDQQIGLTKWELAGAKDDSTPLPDPQEYVAEEAQVARQCVTEGQAQAVWFNYMLAPMGKNMLTAPEFVDAMRAAMGSSKDSPIFAEAPMFLQESLLMPYSFGLDFVRTVLTNRGKEAAFAGLLHDPPVDTRQIMQPETYLLHQVVAPPEVPNFDALVGPAYERWDFGSMGEFDVYLLAKQYGAEDTPNYYRHWRGGYYFAAHAKSAPKNQVAMLYYSKWDSPEAAYDFAKLYISYMPKRYGGPVQISTGCPIVSNGARPAGCNLTSGSTPEGPFLIEWHDNDLLIMEGYEQGVIEKARQVFFYRMSLPAQAPKGKK
jgi:hypothetical protein